MLVVQKYGGSSLGSPEKIKLIAKKIANERKQGKQLVVVVSAMGKTTDDLMGLALKVSDSPSSREMDMLLTAGERVSMALLSMALVDLGVTAQSLTGSQSGIITNSKHRAAQIQRITGDRIKDGLGKGAVVIVAGFQGVSEEKEITTLGRGGSDTSAVALAVALEADACEIYSDVDGVYSADPNVVAAARHFPKLSYDLAIAMSCLGMQALHFRSVILAKNAFLPISLRKNLDSTGGTLIGLETQGAFEAVILNSRLGFFHAEVSSTDEFLDELDQSEFGCGGIKSIQKLSAKNFSGSEIFKVVAIVSLENSADAEKYCQKIEQEKSWAVRCWLEKEVLPLSVISDGFSQGSPVHSTWKGLMKRHSIEPLPIIKTGFSETFRVPLNACHGDSKIYCNQILRDFHRELF